MKIAIFGKIYNKEMFQFYNLLFNELGKQDCHLAIHSELWTSISEKFIFHKDTKIFTHHSEIPKDTDFVFSIGGDGTLLHTVSFVKDSGIPILGLNTGRLGFIASISKDEIHEAIQILIAGKFKLDRRGLLILETSTHLFGDQNFALNEVTVHKKESSSMISIHAFVNNLYLNTYLADGLIVATPTGSTAYSLSCGGPIISPDSENVIITPIATHNLTVRPIVLPDSSKIRLKVEGRDDHFFVSLDSRSASIDSLSELTIRKAAFNINLVKLPQMSFFSTIREKLMWGLDKRN
jgi:NAD+ kinase